MSNLATSTGLRDAARALAVIRQLQRTYGNRATAALIAGSASVTVQRDTAGGGTAAKDPMHEAGDLLQEVGRWADDEMTKQKVIDAEAVVGLDPKQSASVERAVKCLNRSMASQSDLAPKLKQVSEALGDAQKETSAAHSGMSGGKIAQLEAQHSMHGALVAALRARDLLNKVGSGVDVSPLVKQLDQLSPSMNDPANASTAWVGLAKVDAAVTMLQNSATKRSQAIAPIVCLLRAFLAINDPSHGPAPTADYIKAALDQFKGVMDENFQAVFGAVGDAKLFIEFATILDNQLHVEADMIAAGATPSSRVPSTETDVKSYFTSLGKKDDETVFAAYTSFAEAFFFHKVVATPEDLYVTVPELLAQSSSITGRKPLVCTGYASIGGEALGLAGATTNGFIVGIRAGDDTLRTAKTLDDAHALCQVTRNGTVRYISNHLVVKTEEEGIGENAVAWHHEKAHLFVGRGRTLRAAVDDAMQLVTRRFQSLQHR
jgi:hypothetical protein